MEEDLGLGSMMGDGEAPIVGGANPRDVPVAREWAPAREPVVESPRPQPTLADGSDQIHAPATCAIPTNVFRILHRVRKKGVTLFLPVTLRNANRFSKFFYHHTLQ